MLTAELHRAWPIQWVDLCIIAMFYKATANTKLGNTDPLSLGKCTHKLTHTEPNIHIHTHIRYSYKL